jgi:uncharacterized protein
MYLNRESNPAKYQIQAYTINSVTINTTIYEHSIIVMPKYLAKWHLNKIQDLNKKHFIELAALEPEIILLGTGANLVFPDPGITEALFTRRIGLEIMTTAAACRTYTALAAEYRNVLAALIV